MPAVPMMQGCFADFSYLLLLTEVPFGISLQSCNPFSFDMAPMWCWVLSFCTHVATNGSGMGWSVNNVRITYCLAIVGRPRKTAIQVAGWPYKRSNTAAGKVFRYSNKFLHSKRLLFIALSISRTCFADVLVHENIFISVELFLWGHHLIYVRPCGVFPR